MAPAPVSALRSADVADLLELLADANSALAAELKAIAGSRRSLSQATVTRLERLLVQMRPAARVRQVLADLDPQVLLDGTREWHRRSTGTGRPR
jgi:predicted component of type VI protein secretion system